MLKLPRKRHGTFFILLDRERNGSVNHRNQLQKSVLDSNNQLGRMKIWLEKDARGGGINSLSWSTDGQLILSASSDQSFTIINPFTGSVNKITALHQPSVLCARFLPHSGNSQVVTSSNNGCVAHYDLNAVSNDEGILTIYRCHEQTNVNQVLTIPSLPSVFISGSEDKTIRLYDLRTGPSSFTTVGMQNIIIKTPEEVEVMSLGPQTQNYIAVGGEASCVRVYDLRYSKRMNDRTVPVQTFELPWYAHGPDSVTSLSYDALEQYLLVNFYMNNVYLFDTTKTGNLDKTMVPPEIEPDVLPIQAYADNEEVWDIPFEEIPLLSPESEFDYTQRYEQLQEQLEVNNEDDIYMPRTNENSDIFSVSDLDEADSDESVNVSNSTENSDYRRSSDSSDEELASGVNMLDSLTIHERLRNPYGYIANIYSFNDQSRTLFTDAAFWGDNYILVGSASGFVFAFQRNPSKYITRISNETIAVHCLQPHPKEPIFATAGENSKIRFWMPVAEESLLEKDQEDSKRARQ